MSDVQLVHGGQAGERGVRREWTTLIDQQGDDVGGRRGLWGGANMELESGGE